jgi:exonuclease III
MRILTWNCNGAFRKKFEQLEQFSADILVIQECEDPQQCKDAKYKDWAENCIWRGENPNKGLAIIANKKIRLRLNDWAGGELKYFISCKVSNEFNVIGAWCHGDTIDFQYIGQFWKYLQINKSRFKDCIIAGDFNSNAIWDKPNRPWNHSNVIAELKQLGIRSLYHLHRKEIQGCEKEATLYLQKNLAKAYHIDYIFGSTRFIDRLTTVTTGVPSQWLSFSDHMPVLTEFS